MADLEDSAKPRSGSEALCSSSGMPEDDLSPSTNASNNLDSPSASSSASNIKMADDYHTRTRVLQEESLTKSFRVVHDQIASLPIPPGSTPWCALDLGCADGLNSIPLLQGCTHRFRQRDPGRSIQLVFEDQPVNDFSKITQIDSSIFGPNVFPLVSNTGFFDPTMPESSVHLSFSSHSMHYLDGPPPCPLSRGLQACDATESEKKLFAESAARCWERLLMARAAELVPGGRAVLVILTVMEDGTFYGAGGHKNSIYGSLGEILMAMLQSGRLTQKEFDWATSPEYYRTIADIKAPFEDSRSQIQKQGHLKLVSCEPQICPCPLRAAFKRGEYEGRLREYGDVFTFSIMAFTKHKLSRAFEHPGNVRSASERSEILTEIYARFASMVVAEPDTYAVDNINTVVIVEKCAPVAN